MICRSTSFFAAISIYAFLMAPRVASGHVSAKETAKTQQVQETEHDLSGQHSPQISGDAEHGNGFKYK